MDYIEPADVVTTMINAGATKGALPVKDLLIRGFLSGALLGYATALAIQGAGQTVPLVGALIFPVGFVMIVLLGLELATGNFGLLPLAWCEGKLRFGTMSANLFWVLLGNLIGSVFFGFLLYVSLTTMGHNTDSTGIAAKLIAVAQAKTLGYAKFGFAGIVTAFVKAMLCNWMVCLGVVMGMTSTSTVGKIVGAWMPIFIFFALGFEHSIVNMFIIPTGMMLGAKVSVADWWLWNQIPVTLGNLVGGFLFTGLALYLTHAPKQAAAPVGAASTLPAGEPAL